MTTEKQRENLITLRNYLAALPKDYEHFNMRYYMKIRKTQPPTPRKMPFIKCGTVACAIGHGPSAGIKKIFGEGWRQYSYRVFGFDCWDWCFSAHWYPFDNTVAGAVKRIDIYLDGKAPKSWEFRKMVENNYAS